MGASQWVKARWWLQTGGLRRLWRTLATSVSSGPTAFGVSNFQNLVPTFSAFVLCLLNSPGSSIPGSRGPPRVSAGLEKSHLSLDTHPHGPHAAALKSSTPTTLFSPKNGKVSKTEGSLKFPKSGPNTPHVDKLKAPFLSE